MSDIIIKSPETDDEFQQYYSLRFRLLRQPWGEPEGTEKDDMEDECFHVIAKDKDTVIGVGRLQFNSNTESQIRYMAVDTENERQGIGRCIVKALEQHSADNKRLEVTLHAREPAVGFYEKLGYTIKEKSYLLFGEIQHYRMQKHLLRT